ncbi:MAG: DUF1553 domain-containing protein [Pirellulales bacterium]
MKQRLFGFCAAICASAFLLATTSANDYATLVHDTPGLLAHYRFEEEVAADANASRKIRDVSSEQHTAEAKGEVFSGQDSAFASLGKAIKLGAGGHLRLPDLGEHSAVTVEMWLKVGKQPVEGIAGLYAADGWTSQFLHFNLKSNGAIEIAINGVNGFPNSEAELVTPGQWTHLVVTYDRETGLQQLYRNGRLAMEVVADPRPAVRLVPASLGAWLNGNPSRPFEGEIDEVAIYATALTSGQVRSHFSKAKGIQTTPVDFAREVQPIFSKHCIQCHGSDTQENQLRLDVRDWAQRGGESGEPAFVPYDADSSHLIQLVTSTDKEQAMPPEGERLSATEIAVLRNWIDQGAPWPDELAGHAEIEMVATKHWSFQPIQKYDPPASDAGFVKSGNAIDAFIWAKLHEKGLSPSMQADKRTLIRRLYLDVHGLPPTPEQVANFLQNESPEAWAQLVDEVLKSPRYGERWASHWLDVVRFGDTHGFEVNTPRENAWPYRDYVIKSLQDDKPYNQFIQEQIAGDQLGVDAATGFLVAAPALLPGQIGRDLASMRLARADELHEVIVSVGAGVMGLTVGCARCHNHKFDPISQRDYYQMQAFFTGLRYGNRPIRNPEEVKLAGNQAVIAKEVFGGNFTSPEPAFRLYRGDPSQRRERVPPDAPAVFGSLEIKPSATEADRRVALAKWLTSQEHPLTSRVIVNRAWQHHFGAGIVATPSDFGAMGFAPTHPELLDFLAATFMEEGWSLKKLHRQILLSNTYRQSSQPRPEALAKDAACQYLWRFPPRRLEMEPIRDSILAVSGKLDLTPGGPGFLVFKPNTNYVRVYDAKDEWGPGDWRRMIYAHRVRMAQDGVFGAFDCPDAGQPQPRRSRSTTAIQALNLFNSTFIKQQADFLAERAKQEGGESLESQLQKAFQLAYAREPSAEDLSESVEVAKEFGTAAVARAIFNSSEFLFLP